MPRYKSRRQYKSRLEKQENKRLRRQTFFIILLSIGLIVLMIFIGIPALTKMAIFLSGSDPESSSSSQQDAIPPQTPQLSSPPEATNSGTLNLSGFSEPGATVTLFQNNQEKIKTVVDANGRFEFLKISLNNGNNSFYAQAKDAAENTSQRSLTKSVVYDIEPPELTVSEPEDSSEIIGVTRRTINVTGNTEPGARLELNGQVVVVKSDGSFSTRHNLQNGENVLTLSSTDKAGNQTTSNIALTYSEE